MRLLGDIPILGALFTSTSTENRETDLVIVVTPKIVETPGLWTLTTNDNEDVDMTVEQIETNRTLSRERDRE